MPRAFSVFGGVIRVSLKNTKRRDVMNPLYTQFKRKFSLSMYKNMNIALGRMDFLKDFINDTRGDLYPLVWKSEGCEERVFANSYRLSGGAAERVFCQFFPFATYEIKADLRGGEVGFVFRLADLAAYVTLADVFL